MCEREKKFDLTDDVAYNIQSIHTEIGSEIEHGRGNEHWRETFDNLSIIDLMSVNTSVHHVVSPASHNDGSTPRCDLKSAEGDIRD